MRLILGLFIFAFSTWSLAAGQIQITNAEGQPIAGAQVTIGGGTDKDTDKVLELVTDVNGYFQIPNSWKSLQPMSVRARGYIPTSFLMVEPQEMALQIHREDSRQFFEVKGETTGFEGIRRDGKVDVGLVYPALSRRDLLQFDVSSIVSPETDEISVITQVVGIPSNLTLPEQTESYILPINLKKPQYRMFVRKPGSYRVTASHAQFPLKRLIKDVQAKKSIFQIINHFRFKSASQIEVDVTGNMENQNISVNQIKFKSTVDITAPELPEHQGVIAASMINQGGLFFPTDIKGLVSKQNTRLRIPENSQSSAFVLSLLTNEPNSSLVDDIDDVFGDKDGEEVIHMLHYLHSSLDFSSRFHFGDNFEEEKGAISLALQPATRNISPQFLKVVAKPLQLNPLRFALNRPDVVDGIQPVATYLSLAEIESSSGDKSFAAEKRYRVWEAFQTGWPLELQLPDIGIQLDPNKKYRWEFLFLGRRSEFNDNDNYFLDGITHVSRTSLDL